MTASFKFYNNALISIVLLTNLIFTVSCSNANNADTNANKANNAANSNKPLGNSNTVKDDVTELLDVVRLPEVPEEVLWKEETGEKGKKLIAVLKYTPENTAKIVALEQKNKTPEQVEIGAENWFPEELVAQSQLSGSESLKGTEYGANDFFNIPYGSGKITRIEGTNYFVLELFTA